MCTLVLLSSPLNGHGSAPQVHAHTSHERPSCNMQLLCKVQLHASRQSASKHAHEHSEHLLACAGTACTARFKVLVGCTISHALYSAATRNLREKGQNWVKVSPPSVKYGLSSASAKLVTRQVNGLEIRRPSTRPLTLSGRLCHVHLQFKPVQFRKHSRKPRPGK